MDDQTRCAELADDLAAVATGAANGPDRARVLAHLAGCEDCRRELEELATVADEVLLVAAQHDPPAGFEGAVLDRIAALPTSAPTAAPAPVPAPEVVRAGPRRWFVRPVLAAAAAVVAAGATAGVVWQSTSDDRELAASYRETLGVADGQYFTAADLRGPGGASAGTAFLYEGEPSWLFVVVRDAPSSSASSGGAFDVVVRSGSTLTTVGSCRVVDSGCSMGTTIDAHVYQVDEITLEAADGVTLNATLRR